MSELATPAADAAAVPSGTVKVRASLQRRHAAETRFQLYGITAICIGMAFLIFLFASIIRDAIPAFLETRIALEVTYDPTMLFDAPSGAVTDDALRSANYAPILRAALEKAVTPVGQAPQELSRSERRQLMGLLSNDAPFELMRRLLGNHGLVGQTETVSLLTHSKIDSLFKGLIDRNVEASNRVVSDQEIAWVDVLDAKDLVNTNFNWTLLSTGNSRHPEQAGIWGAVMGSFFTLVVTLALSFPIGVAAAVYLEEFAPKNTITDIIEVNINNLAAVPSIVFGLLGLAVFINFFGIPRSTPVVGGVVLALMTLPTIIISARASLKSVPPSIREAALGMGASRMQAMFHHTLPLALPGIMTGTIIGMAQALGETAPLLMIGMVAFIVDVPGGFFDSATVLPVQIYMWSDLPERAFVSRTSAAILVLLVFLIAMNAVAVILRKRFERKW